MTVCIGIASQKGGVGKTTIATNLAGYYDSIDMSVLLIDADPQGNSHLWASNRKKQLEHTNVVCTTIINDMFDMITDIKESNRYDVIVLDLAGVDSDGTRSGLLVSDYVITPFRPSLADISTITALNDMIGKCKAFNRKLKNKVLIQGASPFPQVREKEQYREVLENFDADLFETNTTDRKAYRDAYAAGISVIEGGRNYEKASDEITSLVGEIDQWIGMAI